MISGLYTALVTPFLEDGAIDINAFRLLLQRQLDGGVDGIALFGTTGEGPTIEDIERERLLMEAVHLIGSDVKIMVGCSSNSTKKAIEHAKRAESHGAHSLLISTPYYNRPTQEGIFAHFKAIADAVDTPICIYNIPSRCAQNIETETIERLTACKNIVCVKESSGNLVQVQDVIEATKRKRDDFTLVSGDDILTLPVLSLGGCGVISVLSNLIPDTIKSILTYWQAGNFSSAQAAHYVIKSLIQSAFIETNPAPIKYMLSKVGPMTETLRLPLVPLKQIHKQKIDEIMKSYHETKQPLFSLTG